MPIYHDQIGREIDLAHPPKRIISTVPSITELVVDLGSKSELVGLTSWCVQPPGLREEKKVIGGTKNLDIEQIRALKPDLILANKEENIKDQIEALAQEFPVWVSDVRNLDQGLEMISRIGTILGKKQEAEQMIAEFQDSRNKINKTKADSFLYFIWKDPWMVAGPDSYISAMVEESGLKNAAPSNQGRYPELSIKQIQELNPKYIILSSEPYSFKSGDLELFSELGFRSKLMDGELFSWYGSRIGKCLDLLRKNPFSLISPE